ncbi:MAG TPA: hypothetical protein VII95_19635 [Terriglobales bacterium]|jgi:hypothetical protein
MADWKTVRFDPSYEEKLDAEIIPLCDALNAVGIVTTSSCVGHGHSWPHVCFEHSTDERIERLARFVKGSECGDYRPYLTMWQKEILLPGSGEDMLLHGGTGYAWSMEVHCSEVYFNTSRADREQKENDALARITQAIVDFGVRELKG